MMVVSQGWVRMLAIALLVSASSGCAKIQSSTSYSETLISRKTSTRTVQDSLRYSVAPRLDGQVLRVALRSEEMCRTKVTPLYRKEAHITRTAAPDARGYAFSPPTMMVYGLLLGGTGVYSYTQADTLGVFGGQQGESTPDDYRNGGLVVGAAGALLLGVALVDALRLTDEDKVVGDVAGDAEITEEACHERATTNTAVIATVGRLDWSARGSTDADGLVHLDLSELPEEAFGRPELGLTLDVGGAQVPLVLASAPTARLLASLSETTTSRLSRDRDARARASCIEQVAAVAAITIDADTAPTLIARTEAGWRRARTTCGEAWEPAHEQALLAFADRVTATATDRALRACAEAGDVARQLLEQRVESDEELELEQLQAQVGERCTGAANATLVVDALQASGKAAAATRLRAAQRDALIEQLVERLRRNDAVGVRAIIAKDRELTTLLRAAPEAPTWLVQMASHWIRALERGDSGGVLRQLCAARGLVLSFAGRDAWARLRADVARRNSITKGARLAKTLDGGGCP